MSCPHSQAVRTAGETSRILPSQSRNHSKVLYGGRRMSYPHKLGKYLERQQGDVVPSRLQSSQAEAKTRKHGRGTSCPQPASQALKHRGRGKSRIWCAVEQAHRGTTGIRWYISCKVKNTTLLYRSTELSRIQPVEATHACVEKIKQTPCPACRTDQTT